VRGEQRRETRRRRRREGGEGKYQPKQSGFVEVHIMFSPTKTKVIGREGCFRYKETAALMIKSVPLTKKEETRSK
jgi:hypothetical protein